MLRLFSIVAFFAACQEPSPVSTKPPVGLDQNQLEVVWRSHLLPSKRESASMTPVLTDSNVLYTAYGDYNGVETPLIALSKDSGIVKRILPLGGRPRFFNWEAQQVVGDKLFLAQTKWLDCIDLKSESFAFQTSSPNGGVDIYPIENYLYKASDPFGSNVLVNAIERTSQYSASWETVYTYTANDGYAGGFSCITPANLPNGDELILFKNSQWNFDSAQGRMDLFCYNLTADSLLWRNKGIEDAGNGIMPMQVVDSVVYAPGAEHFFAVNLNTGQVIWEFDYGAHSGGDNVGYGDFFINGDRLLLKPSGDHLIVFNRHNGQIIHNRLGMGYTMKGRFTHFEGKLWYIADADLKVVDDFTGESLLPAIRQDHLGKLNENVVIDPETRLMYLCNYHEALCVKLPEDL
jgi:outer membrane protein assembly factor BamB